MEKTSNIRLNLTENSFVFGRIDRENAPRNLFVNLECGELPKCVCTSRQTASFLDAKIVYMRPEPFLQNLQAKNSKIRLNFTENCFVFGHINRENAL